MHGSKQVRSLIYSPTLGNGLLMRVSTSNLPMSLLVGFRPCWRRSRRQSLRVVSMTMFSTVAQMIRDLQ